MKNSARTNHLNQVINDPNVTRESLEIFVTLQIFGVGKDADQKIIHSIRSYIEALDFLNIFNVPIALDNRHLMSKHLLAVNVTLISLLSPTFKHPPLNDMLQEEKTSAFLQRGKLALESAFQPDKLDSLLCLESDKDIIYASLILSIATMINPDLDVHQSDATWIKTILKSDYAIISNIH